MKIDQAIRIGNLVLGCVNIALFFLWFSMIKKDSVSVANEQSQYLLNQVSMQITALGVGVAFGALLLGGLGIFGFQVAMERAESRADASARQLVAKKWDEYFVQGNISVMKVNAGPSVGIQKVEDAQEATDI